MFRRTIKSLCVSVVFAICFFALASNGIADVMTPIFINEIHYDNASTDTGEAVEIFGPAETNLSDWRLYLYNGSGGGLYLYDGESSIALGGTIPNQQDGYGTLSFSFASNGLQNGPDGLALVNDLGSVIQFLSYEGTFMATEGPAAVGSLTSTDIGVSEDFNTPVGYSLQLRDEAPGLSHYYYEDFTWTAPIPNTFGDVNTGAVPIPGAVWLLGSGLVGIVGIRRKYNK